MPRIVSELIYKLTADDKDLRKKLLAAEESAEATAKALTKFGTSMTKYVTLPIAAAGAAAIKFASDANEALNATNVVFKDSSKIITDWGKNAAEQAGLSAAEFYQAAAVIGSGLINAGASAEEAASQTITLTKRAADLASIFNTDVNEAIIALQAGLRGESEPLRRFGVSLDEAGVKAKAAALGLVDASGEVTNYGKSQARLALILEQSNGIAGDFVNTSDQLANGTRVLTAQLQDEAAALGKELLPFILDAVKAGRDLVEQFSALPAETKTSIVQIALLVAGIGPLTTAIGGAVTAFNNMRTALILLQAAGGGPLALAVAGVAALTTAITSIGTEIGKAGIKEAGAGFEAIAKSVGIAADKTDDWVTKAVGLVDVLRRQVRFEDQGLNTVEQTRDAIKEVLANRELDYSVALQIVTASKELTKQEKDRLTQQIKSLETERDRDALVNGSLDDITELVRLTKERRDVQVEQVELVQQELDTATKLAEIKQTAKEAEDQRYRKAQALQTLLDAGYISEADYLQGQIDAWDELIRKYADGGVVSKEVYTNAIRLQDQYKKRLGEITVLVEEDTETTSAAFDYSADRRMIKTEQIYAVTEDVSDEATKNELSNIDKMVAAYEDFYSSRLNQALRIGNLILGNEELSQQYAYDAEKERIEKTVTDETDKQKQLEALDKEFNRKKAESARKQAEYDRDTALLEIAINTAIAITKVWPDYLQAALIGALGVAEAAAVASRPLPPVPQFATGGSFTVPAGFANDSFPIAMAQSDERVTVETPAQAAMNDKRGITLQVGTLIADPAGLRELDRQLKKYGVVNTLARGN